ncbi:TonB-dependent receptor [Puteibacter caeruleilacunae]|nr:TonB-dependent receptor [Puteibacter caeruleilacunae]
MRSKYFMRSVMGEIRKKLLWLFVLILNSACLLGQQYSVSGKVTNDKGISVSFAAIQVKGTNIFTYTDEKGLFRLDVAKGDLILEITSLGFRAAEKVLEIKENIDDLELILKTESLHLDEVEITAKSVVSDEGTSTYKIGNQAIEQIQAMSLGDILNLLPGQKVVPPNMNKVQQANLRTASPSDANSFGTAVVIDGVALNNDANLQAKSPGTSFGGGMATPAQGVDLRAITASSIESVEIITGVPSARYGNITSGAIIVNKKKGKSPLYVGSNLTSTSYQGSFTKGFNLPGNKGILNTNVAYTYSNASTVDRTTFYNNVDLGLTWTCSVRDDIKWNNTTSFSFGLSDDGHRQDPDEIYRYTSDVKNQSYRLSLNGFADVLGKLSYAVSGSITNQSSYFYNTGVNGPVPIVEGLESGTYFTGYTKSIYTQITDIKGLPMSFDWSVYVSQNLMPGKFRISFDTGAQYSYSKNKGKGRVISGGVSLPAGVAGSRSAKFHDIPASQNLSLWHESDLSLTHNDLIYNARFGFRYDYMNRRYHLFSPRLSGAVKFYDLLRIRGAWGLSYKAPAMIQLYPGPVYQDYTNMSYYAPNPLERLAIVTTYVYEAENDHLKPSKGNTLEFGIDLESESLTCKLTGYYKKLTGGIYHSPELLLLYRQNYRIVDTPVDQPPIVEEIPGDIDTLIRTKTIPRNVYSDRSRGVELTIIPAKIKLTNTRLNLTFSYMKTTTFNDGHYLRTSSYVIGDTKTKWGVYENNKKDIYLGRGNLTVIQQIPSLGLIFNLTAELNVANYSKTRQGSLYPYAYYSPDGEYNSIPEEEQDSPKYADLKLADNTYEVYDKPPFHTNYHLQVRKETKQGHSFRFFANNVFWHNPEYEIKGNRRSLNSRISYGFGMSFKL